MRYLFFVFVALPALCLAQADTIFTIDQRVLPCTIVLVNEGTIFFTDSIGHGHAMPLTQVKRFSQQNKPAPPQVAAIPRTPASSPRKTPVEDQLDYMRYCLRRHATEYFVGVGLQFGGLLLTSVGGAAASGSGGGGAGLVLVGLVCATTGFVMTIDSHKWFRRASIDVRGNGVGVRYRFK